MINKYAKSGDFIQIMLDSGSYYGKFVEFEDPWLSFTDHGDGDLTVVLCGPGCSFIFGKQAEKNCEIAMLERARGKQGRSDDGA